MEGRDFKRIITAHGDTIITDIYITRQKCARRGCKAVILYIDNGCGECGKEFRAPRCTCRPRKYCCSAAHKDKFECLECKNK